MRMEYKGAGKCGEIAINATFAFAPLSKLTTFFHTQVTRRQKCVLPTAAVPISMENVALRKLESISIAAVTTTLLLRAPRVCRTRARARELLPRLAQPRSRNRSPSPRRKVRTSIDSRIALICQRPRLLTYVYQCDPLAGKGGGKGKGGNAFCRQATFYAVQVSVFKAESMTLQILRESEHLTRVHCCFVDHTEMDQSHH